jgi:hypothetical protein
MAQDQKKGTAGGNTPKSGNPPGGSQGQSAKDRSRAQSRPVSGKAPTGKSGRATGANKAAGGGGGNKPRPGGRPAAVPPKRTVSGAMLAWGAVGLVVVIIVALVVVKATSTTNTSYTPVTAAPASVVHDVTNIPLSVYNTVGVNSPTVAVNPPTVLPSGSPDLTLNGKAPSMLFIGAEYCPYCAAERWAMTAALSRFGTWSGLKVTASSHTDVDPQTNTFSYRSASLTSPYITFTSVEAQTNIPTASGSYTVLQAPTAAELRVYNTDASKYVSNYQAGALGYPFVNINNVAIITGPSYDPGVLAGQTWQQIANGLSDPTNPATQAIVATANYISAAICASSKNAPAAVCNSPGVQAATKALKLG